MSIKVVDKIVQMNGQNYPLMNSDAIEHVKSDGTIVRASEELNKSHDHSNKEILDKFSEDNEGNPLYDGKPVIDEVNVQADFLTEGGFGKLRYYNGAFQYYNESSSTWIDTAATPDNVYILNMIPQTMQKITGIYSVKEGKYKLQWDEPDDTTIDGQVAVLVEKVVIRRKLGSVPTDENDGDLVIEIKRRDFHTHNNTYYTDNGCMPSIGDIYYYKAFPIATTGLVNTSSYNEISITCKEYYLYGFKLDQNESDPASMITYLPDCVNADFNSAYMDYSSGTFNYGDWEDAWFIHDLKPCMLKYDGTIDYELNPNDYTKKLDGTDSDVANADYEGNAMIGIPKVYWKIVDNGDNTANIYFSNDKVDNDFHCWSHIDNNGNEIDYCYMPIYTGSLINSKLRSISGQKPISNYRNSNEVTYATANNTGSDIIWYTETFSDRMLINLLLLLIGKSTDTQTIFGTGNNNSYVSTSNTGVLDSGTMNTKGLFWGSNDNTSGVKVFGMEHYWGNQWRRIAGWIYDNKIQKIKMTYGQSDGSTVDGYNTNGSGYITINNSTPSGSSGGYISKMLLNENGLIPATLGGSSTTYFCDDIIWDNSNYTGCVFVGGYTSGKVSVGAFTANMYYVTEIARADCSASISCKPLATI